MRKVPREGAFVVSIVVWEKVPRGVPRELAFVASIRCRKKVPWVSRVRRGTDLAVHLLVVPE